jgi:DNA-binding transcriptional LysR family regulator
MPEGGLMELRQIRYFVAVAETGNIGAAARKLHISQPPVTRQIHKLEQEIGGDLLVRTPKGVELTDAGKAFLVEAKTILAQSERAIERSRSAHLGEIGTLDVGFMGSPIYSTIPKILHYFRERSPQVSISLHRLGKQQQIDALRDGRLHVGFARYYPEEPDLQSEQVELEPPALAVAESSHVTDSPIRLKRLKNIPLIVFPTADRPNFADTVMQIFKQAQVEPRVSQATEDLTSALALTAAGLGCCLVPATVAGLGWPGIRFMPIANAKPMIPVHCIYRGGHPSPVLSSFIDALRHYQKDRPSQ